MKPITINITNLIGNLVITGDVNDEKKSEIKQTILNALLEAVRDVNNEDTSISVSNPEMTK